MGLSIRMLGEFYFAQYKEMAMKRILYRNIYMNKIVKKYIKKFGYTPTIFELRDLYSQGLLALSDKEENILKI